MKKILLAVLIVTVVTTGLQAQTMPQHTVKAKKPVTVDPNTPHNTAGLPKTDAKEKMEHGHKSGIINAKAVPASIKSSFEADVDKPTNVKWAKHDSTYEVWFTDWGFQKFRVYYNDTSSDVAEMAVKQIPKMIPDNVKKYVLTNYKDKAPMVLYKGYAFRTDANVQKNLDKPYLRIDMADHTLYFDTDGNFVKEAYTEPVKPKMVM